MAVNMDWLRQKVRSREVKPIWYDGLGDMERLEEYRAYSTLLAFLEGYDPQEHPPKYDVPVRITWEYQGEGCQAIATYTIYQGEAIYIPVNSTGNYVPPELVTRWYPIGGQ